MKSMNASADATHPSNDLSKIIDAEDLRSLNGLLTAAMAQQRIQAVIKGDDLDRVADTIVRLAGHKDSSDQLLGAAMLGRLAAVARGREMRVLERVPEVVSIKPASIDTLGDEKEKAYAAQALRYATGSWIDDYCANESLIIDAAEAARRETLSVLLDRRNSIAAWMRTITEKAVLLRSFENPDSRLKRVRRIVGQMYLVASDYQGDLGANPGEALAALAASLIGPQPDANYGELVNDTVDGLLGILARMIEMRFSEALVSETYAVIDRVKRLVGAPAWVDVLSSSKMISFIRIALLETALVLARQNRTDKKIIEIMAAAYSSKAQSSSALQRHFSSASDLDPEVKAWWVNGGVAAESVRKTEHTIGNSEDQQIGALLIEVESNQDAMEKLLRAVVPFLEISDPVLASTVRKAVAGYTDAAQIARRLARMRKLSKTDLKGSVVEYNPLEHEMLGGHRSGVRTVKIVRDGIRKDFAGRIKTLVKPRVEPFE